MNAMIFAAGLGSRMQPITNSCPKALVKIGELTLLEIALNKMAKLGISKVVVNVHHFANQVVEFIENYLHDGMEICISDESNQLLDTGGGLLKAAPLFDKDSPILIYNVDVFTNANLQNLVDYHQQSNNLATLLVQNRNASRYLMFDENNLLCGWKNPKTIDELWVEEPKPSKQMGFNGIQIINYQLLNLINEEGAFPIIPTYLQLAKSNRIGGWDKWTGEWFDIGSPDKLNNVTNYLATCNNNLRQTFF
jgi:NDP-sugar pyrophosphorylase family protein